MSDWQTIETAPKDGTHILGYGRYYWGKIQSDRDREMALTHGHLGHVIMRWAADDDYTDDGGSGGWLTVTANPYEDGVIPLAWKPLDAPPPA